MRQFFIPNLKTFFPVLMALLCSLPGITQTTYNISDPEDLEAQTYVPGDEIILANGTYNTDERITFVGNGTADQPIIFRAETPGGVKFTGGMPLNIGGDYVVVDGFHWEGGFGASNFIQFRHNTDYANHSTIQNCAIDGLAIHPDDVIDDMSNNSITKHRWIVLYGTYNSVLNCTFMNKESAGALVLAEYQFNAEANACATVGHTISNNYFYRYAKIDNTLSNSGDSETIRIGTSEYQHVNSNVTVSNNYFVEADGENEIISNKSKGNIYSNNTFRRCRGSLVLRHGSEATVDRNYFLGESVDGTGGIRITDANHNITNNYMQDCVTRVSQAIWNNGVTFLGGGVNPAVPCTSNSVSNGYQRSESINFSNNTFVNTNAPFFYNVNKGSTDPTGTVSDNLVYFSNNNPNISDVISGDTPASYSNLGTSLNYSGNIFTGTSLGESNNGFSESSGITATASGEIFTFSGTDVAGKGADMGAVVPITDDRVGYGIGACFLNNTGGSINDGDCTIMIGDLLTVSTLPVFPATASSAEVNVTANTGWTAEVNDSWISIDANSGTGGATVTVTVTDNPETEDRVGTITFTQDPGGDDIIRTLSVTQEGIDLSDLFQLINTGTGQPGDRVTVHSFSREEVNGVDKFNFATNTLDKDNITVWAADDGPVTAGDYRGDGEYIIYDLGDDFATIRLIQFTTTDKSDAFGYEIWVSDTGTEDADFTRILPVTGDMIFTATNTTEFNQYPVSTSSTRYVKLVGYGRFNSDGDTRTSVWSAIGEIEFYGELTVSTEEKELIEQTLIYPVPANNMLHLENLNRINLISIYGMNGQKRMDKKMTGLETTTDLDISGVVPGTYMLVLTGAQNYESSVIIISR